MGLPYSSDGEETACNSGGPDLIPGSERSHEEGNDNLLQYSCLKNPMDRGAWWASLWGHKESDTTERARLPLNQKPLHVKGGAKMFLFFRFSPLSENPWPFSNMKVCSSLSL